MGGAYAVSANVVTARYAVTTAAVGSRRANVSSARSCTASATPTNSSDQHSTNGLAPSTAATAGSATPGAHAAIARRVARGARRDDHQREGEIERHLVEQRPGDDVERRHVQRLHAVEEQEVAGEARQVGRAPGLRLPGERQRGHEREQERGVDAQRAPPGEVRIGHARRGHHMRPMRKPESTKNRNTPWCERHSQNSSRSAGAAQVAQVHVRRGRGGSRRPRRCPPRARRRRAAPRSRAGRRAVRTGTRGAAWPWGGTTPAAGVRASYLQTRDATRAGKAPTSCAGLRPSSRPAWRPSSGPRSSRPGSWRRRPWPPRRARRASSRPAPAWRRCAPSSSPPAARAPRRHRRPCPTWPRAAPAHRPA